MKLFCFVLAGAILAKTPHSKKDFDEMDEEEHKKLDQDVFNFDPEEYDEDWDPWELEEDEIKARLSKVFKRIDDNRDGNVDRNELIAHTYKALYSMDEQEAEEEFLDADQDADTHVNWAEFVFEFYGLEKEDEDNILEMDTDTGTEFNRMYARDKGRFHAADFDSDGKLNLMEFQAFKNPMKTEKLRDLAIEWAMRDVDKNGDGKISLEEYMGDYLTQPDANKEHYGDEFLDEEKHRFNDDFDRDGNGFIEGPELQFWMGPDNTEIAIEETEHILEMSDEDGNGLITLEEVLNNHDLWVDSDATQFGQQLRYAHDEL